MCKENFMNETFKFVMNIYSPLLYIPLFGFFCDISDTKSRRHRRLVGRQDEIYLPSFVDFELKGRSLALIPVKLKNGCIEKLQRQKHRKCRYIEEKKCNGTDKPKRIFNALEDKDDPNAGKGPNDNESDNDYSDDNNTKNTPIAEEPTIQTGYETDDAEVTTIHDHTTDETTKFYNTEEDIKFTIPDMHHDETTHTSYTTDVTDVGLTTDLRPARPPFEPTTKGSIVDQTSGGLTTEGSTDEYPKEIPTTQGATIRGTDVTVVSEGSSKDGIDTESVTTQPVTKPSSVSHSTVKMDFTPKINHSQPTTSKPDIRSTSENPHMFPNNTAVSLPHFTDNQQTLNNASSSTVTHSLGSTVLTEKHPTEHGTWSPIDFHTTSPDSGPNEGDEEEEDYYLEDKKDEEMATTTRKMPCIRRTKHRGISSKEKTTRLPHIETPPFPQRPLDLNFPTCSGTDDSLDIKPPSFKPACDKKEETCKHHKHKPTHHTTTTPKFYRKQALTRKANAAKKYPGNPVKYAQVLVRIPPSLAELPVVVLKDPHTQKLCLSLISGEQAQVQQRSSYYQPNYYQSMFPPPFSYNSNYFSSYNPFAKVPYKYFSGPSVLYKKASYLVPKHYGYPNNLRWIRDTFYEDEENLISEV